MSPFEYQQTVEKRAAPITKEVRDRVQECEESLIFHLRQYQMLCAKLDVFKKHIFYGKPLSAYQDFTSEEIDVRNVELLHSVLGCATEAAELIEHLGNKDWTKCSKEIGDIQWYVALGASAIEHNLENIMVENDAKLEARYKGGFTEKKAQEHNGQ